MDYQIKGKGDIKTKRINPKPTNSEKELTNIKNKENLVSKKNRPDLVCNGIY